jgi:hypothetical protein
MPEPNLFEKTWNRHGLTEAEWSALTPEDRVVHYNRNCSCEHKANIHDWPVDLRESYSFDPYFNTAHMEVCQRPKVSIKDCPCQMCKARIGVAS